MGWTFSKITPAKSTDTAKALADQTIPILNGNTQSQNLSTKIGFADHKLGEPVGILLCSKTVKMPDINPEDLGSNWNHHTVIESTLDDLVTSLNAALSTLSLTDTQLIWSSLTLSTYEKSDYTATLFWLSKTT